MKSLGGALSEISKYMHRVKIRVRMTFSISFRVRVSYG